MDYCVGIFQERCVLAGFEDVGAFPGNFVGPVWRVWGGCYGGPNWLTGAAGRVSLLDNAVVCRRNNFQKLQEDY